MIVILADSASNAGNIAPEAADLAHADDFGLCAAHEDLVGQVEPVARDRFLDDLQSRVARA